ncbi:MAG: FliM/FliN family flagellar motor switch protein [Alphaproteobacteria bacterium]|nr:FliM/FliN family flagellar motor switch protein [Alphaproteobacteria bacterium]MCB9928055.1 FliM/FliN family flagellar motor switch protein [Alphaproteobacteria bacterium]
MELTAASRPSPAHPPHGNTLRGKLDKTTDRFDRYPLLDVVCGQFVRLLSQRLTILYGAPVAAYPTHKDIKRFGAVLETVTHPALYCVFAATPWPESGLVVIDGGIAEANLEFLLGADEDAGFEPEWRVATRLDRVLASRMVDAALGELALAFTAARAEIGTVSLVCSRVETAPQFAAIAADQSLALALGLHLEIGEANRSGQMDVVLPMAMLEPIRRYLSDVYRGERTGQDREWARHLTGAVMDTRLAADVELERLSVPFERVMSWQVGDVLPLSSDADTLLEIRVPDTAGRTTLLRGSLGAMRGHKAIKLVSDDAAEFAAPIGRLARSLGVPVPAPPNEPPPALSGAVPDGGLDDEAAFGLATPGAD